MQRLAQSHSVGLVGDTGEPFDPGLPALGEALDPEVMAVHLLPLLGVPSQTTGPLAIRSVELLVHKPGRRAVLRYVLDGPEIHAASGQKTVLVKLYGGAETSIKVYRTMAMLAGQVFIDAVGLGLPEPLGCLPELGMLVYRPVLGQSLMDLIASPDAIDSLRRAGAWLARLHRSGLALDRRFHLENELESARAWAMLIGKTLPDVASSAGELAEGLRALAASLTFETDTPLHKDFHPGHVFVDRALSVIDFDEMRLGDPSYDVAHFLVNLCRLTHRRGLDPEFPAMQRAFIDSYAHHTGWRVDARLNFFRAYTCMKVARQMCARSGPQPHPAGEALRRDVRWALALGRTALEAVEGELG